MELMKELVRLSQTVYKGETRVMAEGDVVVPDIKPDILKLLQVDAVSYITNAETSDGVLNIEGCVDLTILYIPDREGERIRSIETVFEFSHRAESKKITADTSAEAVSNVVKVDFSAVNSRKVKIKAAVSLDYEVCGVKETEIPFEIEGDAEVKKEEVKLRSVTDISTHRFNIRENIEIPNAQGSVNEILKTDVKISDTDYKAVTGKVVVKGETGICVLYTNEQMDIEFTEAEIPFTEVLDSEDVNEETICDIEYCVCGIDARVEEDSDGDRRIIALDISVEAQLKAEEEINFDMISDCYIPGERTITEADEVEIEELAASPSMQNTIREVIEFDNNSPRVSEVYNVITRPLVQQVKLQRGKLLCEGKISAYVLYLSENSDNPVYSMKKDIPFSYMMECDVPTDGREAQLKADIRHTSYNLNSAGELELRCILSLSSNVIQRRKIKVIKSVEGSEEGKLKNGIVIYFVQSGDTLWDIAKRYSVTCGSIKEFNKMEKNELSTGDRLFIP